MKLRPSTQLLQDGAVDGQALVWDDTAGMWLPSTISGSGSAGDPAGLTGATASTRYVGGTASGPPTSGTFAVGDFIVSQDGYIWICITAGSPGGWVRGDGVLWKDRCNRANSATSPGSGWTVVNGLWGITSNQLYCSSSLAGGVQLSHDLGVADNYTFGFDCNLTTGSDMGCWLRYVDSSNGLAFAVNPLAGVTLFSVTAGVGTNIGSGGNPSNGDRYELTVTGTQVICDRIRSGTRSTQFTATASSFTTATKIALRSQNDTVSRWDNIIIARSD